LTDYTEGKLYEIKTWNGTGTAAFSGKIGVVGTATDDGVFSATATGTVYLVIRGGGNDMMDGISITNVEFIGSSK
jgi:phage tail sheath gpL-like